MKIRGSVSLVSACLGALAFSQALYAASAPPVSSQLSPARYMGDVGYLASEAMQGRGNGSPELEKAAEYIADQFRRAGLQPAGDNNGYFQAFTVTTGATLGARNELRIGDTALKINDDFVPIVFSDSAEFQGPLIFAGYGITAPEFKYDDYAGIDAANKIVVVFTHEPQELDPKSAFAGTDFTPHASFVNKAINARMHGAKGIIFITDPGHDYEDLGGMTRREQAGDIGIPAMHAKRAPVVEAFKKGGKDLAALHQAIDKDLAPQSFEVAGATARIVTDVVRTRKTVRNVLAALPGSDPVLKNEWIVIGAHYDHLGLGGASSLSPSLIGQPHLGADDNASGTAGVLEIARAAAMNPGPWKRSVLFMAFAGEEIGLLGSSHFTNYPTVPLGSITAMINMDMIGRVSNGRITIGGVGTSPSFKPALEELSRGGRLAVAYTESGYGASDQTAFNAKKIPVLFFFSGTHTDYHKPSDTADKINVEGALDVLSLVTRMTDRVANAPARLTYAEVQEPRNAGRGSGGGYGPFFGSVPDFRDDIKGVLFADVVPNSPAAKAGLKGGDTLVEMDGKTIQSLSDYAFVLRQKKPGDVVGVTVKREGTDLKVSVTLEARK
jgi:aminopeptidase YwaD